MTACQFKTQQRSTPCLFSRREVLPQVPVMLCQWHVKVAMVKKLGALVKVEKDRMEIWAKVRFLSASIYRASPCLLAVIAIICMHVRVKPPCSFMFACFFAPSRSLSSCMVVQLMWSLKLQSFLVPTALHTQHFAGTWRFTGSGAESSVGPAICLNSC